MNGEAHAVVPLADGTQRVAAREQCELRAGVSWAPLGPRTAEAEACCSTQTSTPRPRRSCRRPRVTLVAVACANAAAFDAFALVGEHATGAPTRPVAMDRGNTTRASKWRGPRGARVDVRSRPLLLNPRGERKSVRRSGRPAGRTNRGAARSCSCV